MRDKIRNTGLLISADRPHTKTHVISPAEYFTRKLTSRLELLVVGVRLPLVKPASMDLVFKEACSFGSMTGGIRWGGTLGLYSTVRLLLWLLDFGGVITALWPTSEQLSSSASSTGDGGNGGNSITSTLTCQRTTNYSFEPNDFRRQFRSSREDFANLIRRMDSFRTKTHYSFTT